MATDLAGDLVARAARPGVPVLRLLAAPRVTVDGRGLRLPYASTRLLAFVALRAGPVDRRRAAGTLWPRVDAGRADGNLRSALWRMAGARGGLLTAAGGLLALRPGVLVDVRVVDQWLSRVPDRDLAAVPAAVNALELLPGWDDDWVLADRQRFRERLLTAMDGLGRRLVAADRCAEAVQVALAAVTVDPLREATRRVLVEAHLAEGNWVEARRSLLDYRQVLHRELGTEPDVAFSAMLSPANRAA